jgi:hypothetical protein
VEQGYVAHHDEEDSERLDEIIACAERDVDWILRKYTGEGLEQSTLHAGISN